MGEYLQPNAVAVGCWYDGDGKVETPADEVGKAVGIGVAIAIGTTTIVAIVHHYTTLCFEPLERVEIQEPQLKTEDETEVKEQSETEDMKTEDKNKDKGEEGAPHFDQL